MTISRKPTTSHKLDEAVVQKLINKGGSVAAEEKIDIPPKLTSVLLRIPVEMLAEIDESVKKRHPVRISRQSWIIEALYTYMNQQKDIV